MEQKNTLTLTEITSIGIGTMIGAGIFALFGEISALAGGYSWLAFLAAGTLSGLVGYSYALMSKVSSTNGGLSEYLNYSWKGGLMGGAISLCYFFSICIVLGLVSKSFGHYLSAVLKLSDNWVNYFAMLSVLLFFIVNATGIKFMGRIEKVLVIFKVLVLIGFTIICFYYFSEATYKANQTSQKFNFGNFINAIALANLSFAGFAVIANTGGSIRKGANLIGKAIALAILVVGLIYISLDIGVFGNMSINAIIKAKDYALAQAAMPVLGQFGFLLLGITAIVSTSTNINANIFSAANTISYMAEEKLVSSVLAKKKISRQGTWAMIITVVLVVIMIFSLDLSQIGDVASLTFLLVHTFVPLGNVLNKAKETNANKFILWLACLANGAVMCYFIYHLIGTNMLVIKVFVGVVLFAFAFQYQSLKSIKKYYNLKQN